MSILSEFQNAMFLVTIVGEFEPGELLEAIIAGYSNPEFCMNTPVLVDARQSLANPSIADVWLASRRMVGERPAGHSGKWAILVRSEPLRLGLASMATHAMESLGAELAVFTEKDAALEYMGQA